MKAAKKFVNPAPKCCGTSGASRRLLSPNGAEQRLACTLGRARPKDWLVVAAGIPNHGAVEILDRGN